MADRNMNMILPSGQKCPYLGFGTWQATEPDMNMADVIKIAIDTGYRHFDCALLYGNEKEIGDGFQQKIDDGTVKREDLFITSKLWNNYHRKEDVIKGIRKSLADLKLDYLDLYLIHWPCAFKPGDDPLPSNPDGSMIPADDIDYVETWQGMEELVPLGLARNIGVSNFNISQLQRILDLPNKVPVANQQIECHPYLHQEELFQFCKDKGIPVTAYSPLGSPGAKFVEVKDIPILMKHPVVHKIAEAHGVGPAVVLIRYQIDRGAIVIPKTANPVNMKNNLKALDIKLTESEMKDLASLERNLRLIPNDFQRVSKFYPFD